MKRLSPNQRFPQPPAQGFTIVEILVVIGIITFLVTMTVTVVSSSISTAREKSTKALIKRIDGLLTQRMVAFDKGLASQNLNNTNNYNAVIAKKNAFRTYFPQSVTEIQASIAAGTLDASLLANYDSSNDQPETQSSEALYLCLTAMESVGADLADKDAFTDNEARDTDGDGLKEFVDAWGQPLRFYRWPTRLIRPAPAGQESTPQTIVIQGNVPNRIVRYAYPIDPDYDNFGAGSPDGLDASLLFGTVQPAPAGSLGRRSKKTQPTLADENAEPLAKDPDDPGSITVNKTNATAVQNYENNFHTPETWSTPLIISAGSDGVLGLYEPTDNANRGRLAQPNHAELNGLLDNITNRNLQP